MSATTSLDCLDAEAARKVSCPIEIEIVSKEDGSVVERLVLLRYAGHYRSGSVETFAIKDSEGRFRLRSEAQLGLSGDSAFEAHLAPSGKASE